jgi:cyclophilin family peptidyl-prolyl cis-trans isomerase
MSAMLIRQIEREDNMRKAAILTILCLAGSLRGNAQGTNAPAGAAAATPAPPAPAAAAGNPVVVIETSLGTIKAELWPDKAPGTVANVLKYVDDKFYDGLIFHRVIDGFMIQGGGFMPDMQQKAARSAIKNEARSDAPNSRGTLAMARTMMVDSASCQFYINLTDNAPLNHRDNTPQGYGYCVFGKVIGGMDVVDKIAKVQTAPKGPYQDVPIEPVIIKTIRRAP